MPDRLNEEAEQTRQAAAYVADLAADLACIARCHRLVKLGHLLDMARLEAQEAARATSSADPLPT